MIEVAIIYVVVYSAVSPPVSPRALKLSLSLPRWSVCCRHTLARGGRFLGQTILVMQIHIGCLGGYVNVIRCLVLSCVCLFAHSLHAQNTQQPVSTSKGVVYRCTSANGRVEYTPLARPGCVVLFLYTAAAPASRDSAHQLRQPEPQQAHDDHPIESGSYVNSAGNIVHRPAHTESGLPPIGASAQCRDGSYSFSQSHRGTCSHHGGVLRWL